MTFSPKAIEAAARALCVQSGDDPDKLTYAHAMQCTGHDREPKFTWQYWMPFAEAALAAALAVDGVALVPREPTAKMIAAAFPTEGERPPPADMKIGAEAIMILEGGRDCGSITGPAVIEAASMCKDYRKMIAAASEGEERK